MSETSKTFQKQIVYALLSLLIGSFGAFACGGWIAFTPRVLKLGTNINSMRIWFLLYCLFVAAIIRLMIFLIIERSPRESF